MERQRCPTPTLPQTARPPLRHTGLLKRYAAGAPLSTLHLFIEKQQGCRLFQSQCKYFFLPCSQVRHQGQQRAIPHYPYLQTRTGPLQ